MSENKLNARGNHEGQFSQGIGGWAEYTVAMTETKDTARHDVKVPPGKVIPIIFLPGVMGSNIRMSKNRQQELERKDNRAWKPDDIVDLSGKAGVVFGTDMGGWLKNATPRERQLIFDPMETEVEYYHYTESEGRFDPEGEETLAADARHQNVPDSLSDIPPLMKSKILRGPRGNLMKRESAAQIARWRGWSEVLFTGSYGKMLTVAEQYLNNMLFRDEVNSSWNEMCVDPKLFGAESGSTLTKEEIKKISACWYPVHAMGYNFLKSNSESSKVIAERIRGMAEGYRKRGFSCNEVIVVTHSMGGLVGRALIHPDHGNLLNDKSVKIIGMYHNVMPTYGAACTYKRMRFGFQEGYGYFAATAAKVIAINGRHATAILANAPAALELLPANAYGLNWLRVVDPKGKILWSWPSGKSSALDSIYLQPITSWWRMINPNWVNPADLSAEKGGGIDKVIGRIKRAIRFTESIENTFHPTNCYSSFCDSSEQRSYGDVIFKSAETWVPFAKHSDTSIPSPENWEPITDDGTGNLKIKAGSRFFILQLQPPNSAGDQTVPSDRSSAKTKGKVFIHGKELGSGYEHQDSYSNINVLRSMLYSIAKIALTADWEKR